MIPVLYGQRTTLTISMNHQPYNTIRFILRFEHVTGCLHIYFLENYFC